MKSTFTVYADPGHAWCKVPFETLADIGMTCADFTPYSYILGNYIYLEEDSDLSKFVKTYVKVTGKAPAFRERHSNGRARIRNYARNTVVTGA